ncbi:MAG: KpsF/GutQ family sugar-phosphate isomerase [Burkholderiaceae bacterium]
MTLPLHSHSLKPVSAANALTAIRRVLSIEAAAIERLSARLGLEVSEAVQTIQGLSVRGGRLVVMGMGKSGHIARKLAATFASTGTPALFVHPAEAKHGDLGMIQPQDLVLAISHSGETEELCDVLPHIKRMGIPLIAMTGRPDSRLARLSDIHLDASVIEEACPLNLAPTASTTAALALGDALAVAVLEASGFSADDFARSHPGGSLGRRLLVRVADVMRQGNEVPKVSDAALLSQTLIEMTSKRLGMTCVVDEQGRLAGIFTDGDLRRVLERQALHAEPAVKDIMTRQVKTIPSESLATEAARLMDERRINHLVVVDKNNAPLGVIGLHDLLEAKII